MIPNRQNNPSIICLQTKFLSNYTESLENFIREAIESLVQFVQCPKQDIYCPDPYIQRGKSNIYHCHWLICFVQTPELIIVNCDPNQ